MKSILAATVLLISTQAASAAVSKTIIRNAEVIVFDAICTPKSASEGILKVNLQMRSDDLHVQGSFYSHSPSSAAQGNRDWRLISLQSCQRAQMDLVQQAGRKLSFSGQYLEESHETSEPVWGTCKESPRLGGTFPCQRGFRQVTKYHRESVLDIGGINIININD